MSDDEKEIDVELDDLDNISSGSGLPENKRALHNAMERKRRDSIKDSFRGLQDAIPNLKGDKSSRAQVLKKTGDYISYMQKKNALHQQEIKELKQQNAQLEAQIRALERAKATGNFASTAAILNMESLVSSSEDLELGGNDGDVAYEDSESDTSDSSPVAASSQVSPDGQAVFEGTVSAPAPASVVSVSGVTLVPGQSLLQNGTLPVRVERVQPGQSLLLSEPLRKKMKY